MRDLVQLARNFIRSCARYEHERDDECQKARLYERLEARENAHATTIEPRTYGGLTGRIHGANGPRPLLGDEVVPLTHEEPFGSRVPHPRPLEVVRASKDSPSAVRNNARSSASSSCTRMSPSRTSRSSRSSAEMLLQRRQRGPIVYLSKLRPLLTDGTAYQLLLTQAVSLRAAHPARSSRRPSLRSSLEQVCANSRTVCGTRLF